ncbi:Phosphohydrolase (fragment) [Burkholderia sp. 8Y]
MFSDAVLEPIRLHVDAKRCLCATAYHARLSADSVRSLQLQGGVFDADNARAFLAKPYAQDALALRRWDDDAKDASRVTPPLAHYLDIAANIA